MFLLYFMTDFKLQIKNPILKSHHFFMAFYIGYKVFKTDHFMISAIVNTQQWDLHLEDICLVWMGGMLQINLGI